MGNSMTLAVGRAKSANNSTCTTSTASRSQHRQRKQQQQQQQRSQQCEIRSKTLPTRSSNNNKRRFAGHHASDTETRKSTTSTTLPTQTGPTSASSAASAPPNGETSRLLLLLYLIHRTWNNIMDARHKSTQRCGSVGKANVVGGAGPGPGPRPSPFFDATSNCSLTITDLDDVDTTSHCYSQYTACSCSSCFNATQNIYNSIDEQLSMDSISEISAFYHSFQMAPSVCKNSPKLQPHNTTSGVVSASSVTQRSDCGSGSINGSVMSYKMSSSENSWPQAVFSKENQRPPVFNPEDYVQALKKFGKRQSGHNVRSIYDTTDLPPPEETHKSATLPHKRSEYKSPIPAPLVKESEMSLRQFASITDLLTKLRADLRVSFPSFVQEFVATPSDGVSLLLEVLRAIQLSQTTNAPPIAMTQNTASMPRNSHTYQRRALLDELACLQCLSICCSRSLEATARLGTTPVGLMPLASSATGQGIRARILAMQLMTAACDRHNFGHGSQKVVAAGHTAVSEAMSTLRLRCSEPVRFRLLVGMLNSGGGSGELQAVGVRFLSAFLESSENLQQRLYLQAELFQAGFDPANLVKTISSSSPWLDALRNELKRFNELYVDVDKMILQARDADRVRSQMVILERRVQILHEEKAVLTSMERRLQERCAELQREIFRLQGAQNENSFKSLDKEPAALPRHVPPDEQGKPDPLEHEDEGISSSETGPSLSPVPILVLPQKPANNMEHKLKNFNEKEAIRATTTTNAANVVNVANTANTGNTVNTANTANNANTATINITATTIEDVMEELDNVVSEAEKQISSNDAKYSKVAIEAKEKEIVPVNIVPQPPRKSRSLAHLISQPGGSDLDGSEYGMMLMQKQTEHGAVDRAAALKTIFDEADYDVLDVDKAYNRSGLDSPDIPEINGHPTSTYNATNTRELLDVIMNARQGEDDPTMKALREGAASADDLSANAVLWNTQSKHRSFTEASATGGHHPAAMQRKPQTPPAQHFNGVFFMTGMNTPQRYPKPDLTAALQARRVTKNLERLEAVFASHNETFNEAANGGGVGGRLVPATREKSRSNQHIYFGSNPTLRLTGAYPNNTTTTTVVGAGTACALVNHNVTTRTRSYTQGSKVTDIPSGMY